MYYAHDIYEHHHVQWLARFIQQTDLIGSVESFSNASKAYCTTETALASSIGIREMILPNNDDNCKQIL